MNSNNKKGPVIEGGTCRCCGVTKKCRLLNIEYEFCGQKEIYFEMFVDCFGLVLSHLEGDEKERLICATCVMRLRDACAFRKQVLLCEEKLLQLQMQVDDESNRQTSKFLVKVEIDDTTDIYTDDGLTDCGQTEPEAENNIPNIPQPILLSKIKTDIKEEKKPPAKMAVRRKLVKRNAADTLTAAQMRLRIKRMREKLIAMHKRKAAKQAAATTSKWKSTRTKQFHNIVKIVENSYVCPFFNTFNSYNCVYCKEIFTNPNDLREHTLSHDPRFYKNKVYYEKDLQIDITRIDCRLCPKQIDNLEVFYKHITRVHKKKIFPNIRNEFLQFNLNVESFTCLECKEDYHNFSALKKHMAEHFGTCICDACGDYFFDEEKLYAHQRIHKKIDTKFSCDECGNTFKTKRGMDDHMSRAHTRKPIYNCNECNEAFFSQILRFKHKVEVHGDSTKTYVCEQCDKVYDKKKSLHAHKRSKHTQTSKFECSECDMKFFQLSLLKEHMPLHTGEKNFKCERCNNSYYTVASLRSHRKRHELKDKEARLENKNVTS